ncbi:MAG TPA: hypothetical protein VLC98_09255 [Phnomibacter sp.]|nr:hypothetical protein [Phnomibacter sp.]
MRKFLWMICCSVLLFACGQKSSDSAEANNAEVATADSSLNEPVYPFTQYLQGQMEYIDSTPIAVERIVRINGTTIDSGYMEKPAFKKAMAFLISVDPNTTALRSKYKEESFHDLSIPSLTFSITSIDPNLPLQQADILLHPETKIVKNVMLKFTNTNTDSSVMQRVLWDHNMKCQVVEIVEPTNGKPYTKITQYIWDRPF